MYSHIFIMNIINIIKREGSIIYVGKKTEKVLERPTLWYVLENETSKLHKLLVPMTEMNATSNDSLINAFWIMYTIFK